MTTSPTQPDLQKAINALTKRIRDLERRPSGYVPDIYVGEGCVYWRGEGSIRDPFRVGIETDPDATNQIECREDGLFVGSGQNVGWDAVVDGSIVASDPDNRLFQGIGEALDYLDSLGMVSVGVAVRSTAQASPYQETANWNTPAAVRLFGIRGDFPESPGGDDSVAWDWNGFQPQQQSNLVISNFGSWTPRDFTNLPFENVAASQCRMIFAHQGATRYLCDKGYFEGCTIKFSTSSSTEQVIAETFLEMIGCDCEQSPSQSTTQNLRPVSSGVHQFWLARGCMWQAADNGTKNLLLPVSCDIDLTGGIGRQDTHVGDGFTNITCGSGRTRLSLKSLNTAAANEGIFNVTAAAASGGDLEIYGEVMQLTVGARKRCLIAANGQGVWDITGPATVSSSTQDGRYIFRGNGVSANLSVLRTAGGGAGGTAVSFIAGDRCNVHVAGFGASIAGAGSYNFDANSNNNILTFAGVASFPVAGVDSGVLNLVTEN